MTVGEFKALYDKLTIPELDSLVSQWSLRARDLDAPVWFRDKSKAENFRYLLRWIRQTTQERRSAFVKDMQDIAERKATLPVRGTVPGTRYIQWDDFVQLKGFPLLEQAITYPFTHTRVASPRTKDGYVSVAAIYNMSAWASWKSSSLGAREQALAREIQDRLGLLDLMRLNHGRRIDQPALFPAGMLPVRNPRRRRR